MFWPIRLFPQETTGWCKSVFLADAVTQMLEQLPCHLKVRIGNLLKSECVLPPPSVKALHSQLKIDEEYKDK